MDANRPRRSLSFGIDSILQEDERNVTLGRQVSSDHSDDLVDPAGAHEHVLPRDLSDAQLRDQTWSFMRINAPYSPPQPPFQVQYAAATVTPPMRASASAKRLGHPYQSRAPARHKKPRTSFTKAQIAILEKRFASQKYLASSERAAFAAQLEMSDSQVKTWFQNRRTKWRRQEAEEREYERRSAAKILTRVNALVGPQHF